MTTLVLSISIASSIIQLTHCATPAPAPTVPSEEKINCGDTKTGTLLRDGYIRYDFTSSLVQSSNIITFGTCDQSLPVSSLDSGLHILQYDGSNWYSYLTYCDAQINPTSSCEDCGNNKERWTTIWTVPPKNNWRQIEIRAQDGSSGDYTLQMYCTHSTSQPTKQPTQPTLYPTTTTKPPTTTTTPYPTTTTTTTSYPTTTTTSYPTTTTKQPTATTIQPTATITAQPTSTTSQPTTTTTQPTASPITYNPTTSLPTTATSMPTSKPTAASTTIMSSTSNPTTASSSTAIPTTTTSTTSTTLVTSTLHSTTTTTTTMSPSTANPTTSDPTKYVITSNPVTAAPTTSTPTTASKSSSATSIPSAAGGANINNDDGGSALNDDMVLLIFILSLCICLIIIFVVIFGYQRKKRKRVKKLIEMNVTPKHDKQTATIVAIATPVSVNYDNNTDDIEGGGVANGTDVVGLKNDHESDDDVTDGMYDHRNRVTPKGIIMQNGDDVNNGRALTRLISESADDEDINAMYDNNNNDVVTPNGGDAIVDVGDDDTSDDEMYNNLSTEQNQTMGE